MRLEGKVAIVTGAARGIGKAIALQYAKEGADLVISDIDLNRLIVTKSEIETIGRKCVAIKSDVSKIQDVENIFKTCLDNFLTLDILAHAAGILRSCAVTEQSESDWDAVINVNLKSTFLCCQQAARIMKEKKQGKIVLIDSCASKTGEAFNAVYCASKAGVRLFGHSLALELAEFGINVNSLAPGTIDTEMIQDVIENRCHLYGMTPEEYRESFNKTTPLGRMGKPEEVAKLAVFLASEDAEFITGCSYNISGGKEVH